MKLIESIKIKNFRGFKDLRVNKLAKINVFVGNNSVGKTSLLDAIFMAINPNNAELPFRTNLMRGLYPNSQLSNENFWMSFFYQFTFDKKIEISIEGKYSRTITVTPRRVTNHITDVSDSSKLDELKTKVSADNSGSFVNGLDIHFKGKNRNEFYSSAIEGGEAGKFRWKMDPKYQEILFGTYMTGITTDSVNIIDKVSGVINRKRKEDLIEIVKHFEPHIVDINVNTQTGIEVDDNRYPEMKSIGIYGAGIVRAIEIISNSIVNGNTDNLLLIDEMENGLHWSKQKLIWKSLLNLVKSKNQQLFITTHSRELLKNLAEAMKEEEGQENGIVKVVRIDRVKDSLKLTEVEDKQFIDLLDTEIEIR